MFENVTAAPPDSILGLNEAFLKDQRAEKINLGVGVFKDASGKTPILRSVKAAEERLLATETTKSYLPIDGFPQYRSLVCELVLGKESPHVVHGSALTVQTPSGSAAVSVGASYLKKLHPGATIWVSDPTWDNHQHILRTAGLSVQVYPYFDASRNALAFDQMISALSRVPEGDVVLLHGCCHNPSGVDPSGAEWKEIARVLSARKALPFVDFAYQGFGTGLDEDAAGLRALVAECPELLIASSFSKNFGLYDERVGALTIVAKSKDEAQAVLSNVKVCVRAVYSNPPFHGAGIVSTILADAELRAQWESELAEMRSRIHAMRTLFVQSLKRAGVSRDFSFIEKQQGMFSFSGLNKEQVARLKDEFGIYIVGSGRMNVAGMTESNIPRLCESIKAVL